MKYFFIEMTDTFGGERLIASFENNRHRDDVLKYWQERFAYTADEIHPKDD